MIVMEQLTEKLAMFIRGVEDFPDKYCTEDSIVSFLASVKGALDTVLS